MKKSLAATLIIMGFPFLVNAAGQKTMSALIKEARASGDKTVSAGGDVVHGGIPEGIPGWTLEVDAKNASDGMTHDFTVFFKDEIPMTVVFTTIREGKRKEEHMNLFCDASGKMNKCFRLVGAQDDKGDPVPGSGKSIALDLKDKAATSMLNHELDFWLKGKYRKPKKAK
jgi:hypothetical protein